MSVSGAASGVFEATVKQGEIFRLGGACGYSGTVNNLYIKELDLLISGFYLSSIKKDLIPDERGKKFLIPNGVALELKGAVEELNRLNELKIRLEEKVNDLSRECFAEAGASRAPGRPPVQKKVKMSDEELKALEIQPGDDMFTRVEKLNKRVKLEEWENKLK